MNKLLQDVPIGWRLIIWFGIVVLIALIAWLLTKVNKYVFRRIQAKRSGLHLAFFQHVNSALIVISCFVLAISAFSGAASVWQTMLGGTAIVSAVLAFAAQDVIKDILAGLMISVNKPFEIGNRIMLEDGRYGIVENITMRHVVLKQIDTIRIIVPNSKINTMQITNLSYETGMKAAHFRFSVSYDSDMQLVKSLVSRAVEDSEYSLPVRYDEHGMPVYTPVYFMSFDESALTVAVTVYYGGSTASEILIDDINMRVRNIFNENGVEIPYKYINVIQK